MEKQKTIKQSTDQTGEVLDIMTNIFENITNELQISSELNSLNIEDSMSKTVQTAIQNPLLTSFNSYVLLEKAIKEQIHNVVCQYFISNKNKIELAYLVNNKGAELHYAVVLKDDENQTFLHNFTYAYRSKIYSKRIPLIIQNIPISLKKEFANEVKRQNFKQIEL